MTCFKLPVTDAQDDVDVELIHSNASLLMLAIDLDIEIVALRHSEPAPKLGTFLFEI